jgi:hypothetical protein
MLNRLLTLTLTILLSIMATDRAFAQNGPAEFSSAPCETLALGPTDEISHLQRIYLFQGTVQTTQYKFFSDAECTRPMFSFVFTGTVEMGNPVASLPDTVEAKVTFTRTLFTLDSPRGMAAASTCADGRFEVGIQRDVSAFTCLFMRPIASCGLDYDIVRIRDGVATPGFRTENMCSPAGRPTQLQSSGARFVEQF